MIRDIWDRLPVIPNDRPTVPSAEADSNRQLRRGRCSILLMIMPQTKNTSPYMIRIATAFLTVSSEILLPKTCVLSFRRNTARAVMMRTAIVVVFMPPAVEPGEPPVSIIKIIRACPELLCPALIIPSATGFSYLFHQIWHSFSKEFIQII